MQTYSSALPGLEWQDVFPAQPISRLTGVPAFLGLCPKDEHGQFRYSTEQPQSLHLWPQFMARFGSETPGSFVTDAVRGFFENGGRDCFVIWLRDATNEALKKGLEAIPETADLVCVPDISGLPEAIRLQHQALVLQHCQEMGDRFAILDTPNGNLDGLKTSGQLLQKLPGSDYGAMYGPWLKVIDPISPDKTKSVPPCGHVAGIYAGCDRAEVPKVPANIILDGVVDVAGLSREQQAQLAQITDSPVNGIRSLRGRGVRIWGARTLSADPQWRYVDVRRLAITIRRWIELNLADVAFEPNDFRLWVRIERELNAYLQTLWQRGYLQGATTNEAFRVRCDGELNSPEVRDRGQVITQIHVAPTIPNEFIQLRLIHGETGVAMATS
jgi:phage tail sheath protein FI